jgi:hypothetical protein
MHAQAARRAGGAPESLVARHAPVIVAAHGLLSRMFAEAPRVHPARGTPGLCMSSVCCSAVVLRHHTLDCCHRARSTTVSSAQLCGVRAHQHVLWLGLAARVCCQRAGELYFAFHLSCAGVLRGCPTLGPAELVRCGSTWATDICAAALLPLSTPCGTQHLCTTHATLSATVAGSLPCSPRQRGPALGGQAASACCKHVVWCSSFAICTCIDEAASKVMLRHYSPPERGCSPHSALPCAPPSAPRLDHNSAPQQSRA